MAAAGHASGSAVVGVTVSFTIIAFVATMLRLYTQVHVVRKQALTIYASQQLCPNDKTQSSIWFWASVWIYYLALCFVKLSILLQYLRVFPQDKFRTACYVLMAVIVAYSCGTVFSAVFACTPVAYFWDRSLDGSCVNQTAVWFANASINIVTDICTAILPLPVLKSLPIPTKQRYALMVVFSLGGFTCIVSILRLQSIYVVSQTKDITWNNPLAAIWSSTEVNVGIICSCLPTLKGCVKQIFPALFSSEHSGYRSNRRTTGNSAANADRRHSVSVAAYGHSLSGREKTQHQSYAYADRDGYATDSTQVLPSTEPADRTHIRVRTSVQQDFGFREDEASSEREDCIPLAPVPEAHHMV
ncbi:hypothetical protein LTR37_005334 [Vermiconidia calcicola]|uniref:Uncharacterized protein n=1 Tax=Vermiconidia calcicola TaxID=1690605 RepID=A0ACC3NJQ0_9PEZI|nr:hypothetical protein LTR37_005334 [Vermiconidia calcicola]